jgi:undecaprenyl-diphosphatase
MRRRLESLVATVRRSPSAAAWVLLGLAALAAATALFLGASEDVVAHNGAYRLDGQRLDWFTDHRSAPLIAVARFLNTAGSVGVVMVLAVIGGVWLWRRGVPVVVGLAPVVSVAGAEVVAALMKVVVNRARPPASLHLVSESDPSFPSGHATAATAFGISLGIVLAVFVLVRTWSRVSVLTAGLVAPVVVGLSRLELGVHWPTDVVAGLALGGCVALATTGLAVWFAHHTEPGAAAASRVGARRRGIRRPVDAETNPRTGVGSTAAVAVR